jgi:uncharacterized protein (DUF3820 family)
MSFGQYRGSRLEEVPSPYLRWVLGEVGVSKRLEEDITAVLVARGELEETGDHMPYGRFIGCQVEEVPLNYLSWFLENVETIGVALAARIRAVLAEANYAEGGHRHGGFSGRYRVRNRPDGSRPAEPPAPTEALTVTPAEAAPAAGVAVGETEIPY